MRKPAWIAAPGLALALPLVWADGTVENLVKLENKAMRTRVLTCHVVAGKYDYAALAAAIKAGCGHAKLPTRKAASSA